MLIYIIISQRLHLRKTVTGAEINLIAQFFLDMSRPSLSNGEPEGILQQLQLFNKTLTELVKAVQNSQSFWNSQLFAAILGASAAIFVMLMQQL
jgi:hypothetical protein